LEGVGVMKSFDADEFKRQINIAVVAIVTALLVSGKGKVPSLPIEEEGDLASILTDLLERG
jgi:hypothetical protein